MSFYVLSLCILSFGILSFHSLFCYSVFLNSTYRHSIIQHFIILSFSILSFGILYSFIQHPVILSFSIQHSFITSFSNLSFGILSFVANTHSSRLPQSSFSQVIKLKDMAQERERERERRISLFDCENFKPLPPLVWGKDAKLFSIFDEKLVNIFSGNWQQLIHAATGVNLVNTSQS